MEDEEPREDEDRLVYIRQNGYKKYVSNFPTPHGSKMYWKNKNLRRTT
jgi:hypothetical protein